MPVLTDSPLTLSGLRHLIYVEILLLQTPKPNLELNIYLAPLSSAFAHCKGKDCSRIPPPSAGNGVLVPLERLTSLWSFLVVKPVFVVFFFGTYVLIHYDQDRDLKFSSLSR